MQKLVHVKAWKCFRHEDSRNCVKGPEGHGPVQTCPCSVIIRILFQDFRAPGGAGTHPAYTVAHIQITTVAVPTGITCRPPNILDSEWSP